ncbi:hypothetical protein GE061_002189 [Apolygus lucorum]|uniref:Uncharacterized protein n=1 Tax=Apolygus lucorum TaxID=248454 RepID=A0A8S9X5T3_APOLU|nr:hypothetical protein GE061_002189 [Apolygus lucorum]
MVEPGNRSDLKRTFILCLLVNSTLCFTVRNQNRIVIRGFQASVTRFVTKIVNRLDDMENYRSHEMSSRDTTGKRDAESHHSARGINLNHGSSAVQYIPEVERSQRRESSLSTRRLESSMNWTLEDWANRIKNIGSDVSIDKFAEMLFDAPGVLDDKNESAAINDSSAVKKRTNNTTFEPLGYSVIDKDERSYQARNLKENDITFEGVEPSKIPWRLSPEEISLYKSRVLDDTTNKHLYVSSASKQESTKSEGQSLFNGTADLMDRINNFPSDVSGCDMADMLLPPPGGKSTKERSAKHSSDFPDVPDISAINDLLKAGLSPEELVTKLLGGTSVSQLGNTFLKKETVKEKPDITDSSDFDQSFTPMPYSIIDKDEESFLKQNQLGNDITLVGLENSNIPWQMSSSDISLFRNDVKSTISERFD